MQCTSIFFGDRGSSFSCADGQGLQSMTLACLSSILLSCCKTSWWLFLVHPSPSSSDPCIEYGSPNFPDITEAMVEKDGDEGKRR